LRLTTHSSELKSAAKNCTEEQSMPSFDWENLDDIAIGLTDAHPDIDPYTVRFTDMHKWVTELPGFAGDPQKSNESKLEAIQQAWHEEWEDRKS
jgi:FeS assembly protein IscX